MIVMGKIKAVLSFIKIKLRLKSNQINPESSSIESRIRILRYADIIDYFKRHTPDNPRIKKRVILRHRKAGGYLITLLFVDAELKPVHVVDCDRIYGKKIIAGRLDAVLLKAFRDEQIIILD